MYIYEIPKDVEYTVKPAGAMLAILNSNFVMYILPFVTVAIIVTLVYVYLKIHHIPKDKWEKLKAPQLALINLLSLLGYVFHELWLVALVIAFVDWQSLERAIVKLMQKSKLSYAEIDDLIKKEDEEKLAKIKLLEKLREKELQELSSIKVTYGYLAIKFTKHWLILFKNKLLSCIFYLKNLIDRNKGKK